MLGLVRDGCPAGRSLFPIGDRRRVDPDHVRVQAIRDLEGPTSRLRPSLIHLTGVLLDVNAQGAVTAGCCEDDSRCHAESLDRRTVPSRSRWVLSSDTPASTPVPLRLAKQGSHEGGRSERGSQLGRSNAQPASARSRGSQRPRRVRRARVSAALPWRIRYTQYKDAPAAAGTARGPASGQVGLAPMRGEG
jgi:hypothetical protein